MKQIAIAFKTTGPNPKQGHRISELVAVSMGSENSSECVASFQCDANSPDVQEKQFLDFLPKLESIVGDSPIIVRDARLWTRFLRYYLRRIGIHRSRTSFENVTEVMPFLRKEMPRQRKDLRGISRKFGFVFEDGDAILKQEANCFLFLSSRFLSNMPKAMQNLNEERGRCNQTRQPNFLERLAECCSAYFQRLFKG